MIFKLCTLSLDGNSCHCLAECLLPASALQSTVFLTGCEVADAAAKTLFQKVAYVETGLNVRH